MRSPIHIIGPCSAETREQVLLTARQLKEACGELNFIFRAGIWKPRTSPNTFQGVGAEGLEWLKEVRETYGLPVATEVATPEHVEAALKAGIDYLWLGARTSANPIAVQELANTINAASQKPKGVLVKNPVQEDAQLWLGNIERIEKTGVPVLAVHRGCNHQPCWKMAHTLRFSRPDIPLLIDPSHMSGNADKIAELLTKSEELQYNGWMVEVHCCPAQALSDKNQQITPENFRDIYETLSRQSRDNHESATQNRDTTLNWFRAEIDEADDQLWQTIAERMDISRRIGAYKHQHNITPLQPERFRQIVEKRIAWAKENQLPQEFVEQLFDLIHAESLRVQKPTKD
jgi:chorismate mutase